jgi:D-beta-D-heptose 7-phosphate kinase/D-beta-D-heptose 1-phosphate adenosyltransferase
VGLNSDESVTRLKGEERPYNNLDQRISVLSSLRCVDAVIVFHEDTPQKLISRIIPDILVKGGDYRDKEVIGADVVEENGGKLVLIDFVHQLSTTQLLQRMKKDKT